MSTIAVEELRSDIDSVLQRVREDKETIEVADDGRVVALIVPPTDDLAVEMREPGANDRDDADAGDDAAWAELMRLGEEISKRWPKGVSAVDAIRDQRRF